MKLDVPGHGVPVQSQLLGNPADGPVTLMQRKNRVDRGHTEQVRHVCPPAAGSAEGYKANHPPQGGLFCGRLEVAYFGRSLTTGGKVAKSAGRRQWKAVK